MAYLPESEFALSPAEKKGLKLTDAMVSTVAEPGDYSDGVGLYLQVRSATSKSWLLKYQIANIPHEMGMGSWKKIPLELARRIRKKHQQSIACGIDPLAQKVAKKQADKLEAAKKITFRKAAERLIANNRDDWKSAKHAAQWTSTLESYVFPLIGDLPIQFVTTELVTKVLADIWLTIPETASRVRARIENIIDSAKARGEFQGENPARLKGHLKIILPKRSKKKSRLKKHAALPYAELPAFIKDLDARETSVAAAALQFQILTTSRPGNALGARWSEFNFDAGTWTIAEEDMKAGVEHTVFLTKPALAVLERMKRLSNGKFVFGGEHSLSDRAMKNQIERINAARVRAGLPRWIDPKSKKVKKDITPHGFRSTFRDWAAERGYPDAVAEASLAHTVSDAVIAAYKRTTFDELRKGMLEDWAVFATSDPAHTADVLPFAPIAAAN